MTLVPCFYPAATQAPNLNIMTYVPNIIDYLRYIMFLKALTFAFSTETWLMFIIYYYIAIALDVLDGEAARFLNQTSKFGTCLDMACDRVSVSVMYFLLARLYPKYDMVLLLFFCVDYGSHFL